MFYETAKNDHGLPRDPFKAIVAPRPIGWITSMSAKGEINLAPYSFFNAVSDEPPIVMFSSEGPKDSIVFIEETKEFVCNLATFDLRDAVVTTGVEFPRGVNEMSEAGLEAGAVPAGAPAARGGIALRARMQAPADRRLTELEGASHRIVVFGKVVGIHIDERFLKNGRLDTAAMQPIARCGYADYAVVDKVFPMSRKPATAAGGGVARSASAERPASRRLDVVAQRGRFLLDLLDAVLDHVADRDDADHPLLLDHRHVPELALRHPFHDGADRVGARAGDDLAGHHGRQRLVQRARAALGQHAHDVALRQNADHAMVGAEHHAARRCDGRRAS